MSDMNTNTITGRTLRRASPEEGLAPGETLVVKKKGGKVFELRRVDEGTRSVSAGLDRLLVDMPPEGPRISVDLSAIIVEERE